MSYTKLERIIQDAQKLRDLRNFVDLLPPSIAWMCNCVEDQVIQQLERRFHDYYVRERPMLIFAWLNRYMQAEWDGRLQSWAWFEKHIGADVSLIARFGYIMTEAYDYEALIKEHARTLYLEYPELQWAKMVGGPGSGKSPSILWVVEETVWNEDRGEHKRKIQFETKFQIYESAGGIVLSRYEIVRPNDAIDDYTKRHPSNLRSK